MMEAISQAAAEITAEMPAGGVDVRLQGRELDFVVHTPSQADLTPPTPPAAAAPTPAGETDEDGGVARITLRLPESVKTRAEDAAAQAGQSLNTWLVSVVRSATHHGVVNVDIDLSSIPFLGSTDPLRGKGNRRMTGWL